jgi:hypothetical protein
MKSISSVFALITTLCHFSFAATDLYVNDPEIKAALQKFHTNYETLREGFAEKLCKFPFEDPALHNRKILDTEIFYSSMFPLHIRDEDYANSFLAEKVDIEHILGLANVLYAWTPNWKTGFTERIVRFLSQVLKYHQSAYRETKLPLEYAQRIAIERCALQEKVLALTKENSRLKSALTQCGEEIWP